jgi:hypothetical protein
VQVAAAGACLLLCSILLPGVLVLGLCCCCCCRCELLRMLPLPLERLPVTLS